MSLFDSVIHIYIDWRANLQSYRQVCANLKSGGEKISARLRQAGDTPANREQAAHVIGMERWGNHRLSSLLNGTAPVLDEYDGYRPSPDLAMASLVGEFEKTRADTLALAALLEPLADQKAVHNDIGNISVKTWLVYLNSHASMESLSIKSDDSQR